MKRYVGSKGRIGLSVAATVLFCVLATLNSGGYRYGASDQAFYIPAILLEIQPSLYPHDAPLIGAQKQLLVFDEVVGGVIRSTGWSLPNVSLGLYLVGLVILFTAASAVGRSIYRSWWTVWALGVALTLRHQIADTGVNTLEGYMHPRTLVFGMGVAGLAVFLRGHSWAALGLVAVGAGLHPTTAVWFGIWLCIAAIVSDGRARLALVGCAAAAGVGAIWAILWGPLSGRLVGMDDTWLAVIADKDYLFATGWPLSTWMLNLGYAAVIWGVYRYRQRLGMSKDRERGLVVGCGILLLIFLASVPFVASKLALAVQLQIPRVFWLLDFLATTYFVWLLLESPLLDRVSNWVRSPTRVRQATTVVLLAVASARGGYVSFIEHPERAVLEVDAPRTDWGDVMDWARGTPVGTHLLVDPGHAWMYGTSVRVTGQRDVYLEEVKDAALAIYSRDAAQRVAERRRDLPDFGQLTPAAAAMLADKYDLDYLVSEAVIDLPVTYHSGRFHVYRLRG